MKSLTKWPLMTKWLCLLAPLALLLMAAPASASTVLELDLDELVSASNQIVVGKVADLDARVEADGRVYSYIRIQVAETLKGEHQREVVIRQIGGRTEELATIVPGMPDFKPDEEVLVFLEHVTRHRIPVVTGMAQGKFHIAIGPDNRTRYAVPQLGDMNLVKPQRTAPPVPDDQSPIKLEGTLRRVRPNELHTSVQELETFKAQIRQVVEQQQSVDEER